MGFTTLSEKYLEIKQKTLKEGSYKVLKPRMHRTQNYFMHTNVKQIGYGELEDFILAQDDLSSKSRHDLMSALHTFWVWLARRQIVRKDQMPEFPQVSFELGWRKTIDKDTQIAILDEIKRLTFEKNPRIYMGCLWLATYINIRPGELSKILEEDVDRERGIVLIRDHKTAKKTHKPKFITLIPEDLEMLETLPVGFPKMHLFRRDRGAGGMPAGSAFGERIFYDYWRVACKNLNVEGVDLYGGTRHSSAQALRKFLSPEGIRRLTGHESNKAFERYYALGMEEMRDGYAFTRPARSTPKEGDRCTTIAPPKPR